MKQRFSGAEMAKNLTSQGDLCQNTLDHVIDELDFYPHCLIC